MSVDRIIGSSTSLDQEYTDHPFIGYRKMVTVLLDQGYVVKHHRKKGRTIHLIQGHLLS